MRRVNRLVIHGPHEQIAEMLQVLEPLLGEGWSRAHEIEARIRAMWEGDPPPGFCFHCRESADHPAVDVWVRPAGRDRWEVSSVTPLKLNYMSLSDQQYNNLLASLQHQLSKASHLFPETVIALQPFEPRLENYLRHETAKLLRTFTRTANRDILQPNDRRLWLQFVTQVHKEDSYLEPAILREWFEIAGWPTDKAADLVHEFQTSQELLGVYDEE
jgi:hypothetical protein